MLCWFGSSLVFGCWLLLSPLCECRVVLGLVETGHWAVLGDFCFHLPKTTDEGHVLAQTLVSTSGNELLLLKGSEAAVTGSLSSYRHKLLLTDDVAPFGSPLSPHSENDSITKCRAMQTAARVREPLKRSSPLSSKPSLALFELTLRIAQDLHRQTVTAVVVNCDGPLNVEYRVAFDNGPSGGSLTQFSCTEQGLLSAFVFFTGLSGALFLVVLVFAQRHKLPPENTSTVIRQTLLVSSAAFFLTHLLNLCHIVAFT
eukprot:GHVS01041023.1.p1 GENE.GHVS01041023.1~~GHVS01041023.1.p1  ORF type:complete len:257 (+),score=26.07 GHVS01041023.1:101-871(+)